jgi:hypothetical protein
VGPVSFFLFLSKARFESNTVVDRQKTNMSSGDGKPPSLRMKQRKSIDQEFHDLLGADLDDSDHYSVTSGVSRWMNNPQQQQQQYQHHQNQVNAYNGSRGQLSVGSEISDGDSFGEASVNSQPDQQYLHELIDDEYHPERVNLLDNTEKPTKDDDESSSAPRLKTKNGIKIRNYSDHDDDDVSISSVDEDEHDVGSKYEGSSRSSWNSSWWSESEPGPMEDFPDNSVVDSPASAIGGQESPEQRIPRIQKVRHLQIDDDESDVDHDNKGEIEKGGTEEESAPENSEGFDAEDDGDNFKDSPQRRPNSFSGRGSNRSFGNRSRSKMLKDSLQNMGKSTKKSLRTINGKTFWSQPFKGLSRNRRAAKKGSYSAPSSPTGSPS